MGGEIPLPSFATKGSAGRDIHACIDQPVTINPGGRALIPSGFAISVPDGFAAFLFARSGTSVKHGIALINGVGVVDSDYRGEIKVGLVNLSDEVYTVNPGDRIAQMVIMPVCTAEFVLSEELDETERASGGFGSTGK